MPVDAQGRRWVLVPSEMDDRMHWQSDQYTDHRRRYEVAVENAPAYTPSNRDVVRVADSLYDEAKKLQHINHVSWPDLARAAIAAFLQEKV